MRRETYLIPLVCPANLFCTSAAVVGFLILGGACVSCIYYASCCSLWTGVGTINRPLGPVLCWWVGCRWHWVSDLSSLWPLSCCHCIGFHSCHAASSFRCYFWFRRALRPAAPSFLLPSSTPPVQRAFWANPLFPHATPASLLLLTCSTLDSSRHRTLLADPPFVKVVPLLCPYDDKRTGGLFACLPALSLLHCQSPLFCPSVRLGPWFMSCSALLYTVADIQRHANSVIDLHET